MSKWSVFCRTVRQRLGYYRALATDPNTPTAAKWLIGIALAYLLSPIDIIPDFVPVLGHFDDLIIVPGLIGVALWLIPEDVKLKARARCLDS